MIPAHRIYRRKPNKDESNRRIKEVCQPGGEERNGEGGRFHTGGIGRATAVAQEGGTRGRARNKPAGSNVTPLDILTAAHCERTAQHHGARVWISSIKPRHEMRCELNRTNLPDSVRLGEEALKRTGTQAG
ncbi:hypothetical protein OJAV_G00205270 [Oryzias javanicus]|uniref:Uncharacterized protein n=1 Tax=Oryzias javanicus TaxID=123683 RepID=A0A3S2LP06_ORYJA|nr:hypothetical protein OJAV_G00205270 [Oryzias javanicus]